MNTKTYIVELTATEIRQIYCFLQMSWATPDSEPNPENKLDEKITALWKEIEKKFDSETCQTCWYYKTGYGCKIYNWQYPPEHPACISYQPYAYEQ